MNLAATARLLDALTGRRVLVVGDVMLDEYQWGDGTRLSPEAPVPVVEVSRRTFSLGGAGNAAANIMALGGVPLLGGVIGVDAAGEQVLDILRGLGCCLDGILQDRSRVTTTKSRIFAGGQQVVRIDCEERRPLSAELETGLSEWAARQVATADVCLISDYGKGVVSPGVAQRLIRDFRQAGKPVVVDPKGTDYAKYRGASVIKPNLREIEDFLKVEIADEATLLDAGRRLVDYLEGTAVLITRGADGMALFRADAPPVQLKAAARQVFDVTGAGDTVVAVLALALAADAAMQTAMQLANAAAGISVSKRGTATMTRDELREAILSEA